MFGFSLGPGSSPQLPTIWFCTSEPQAEPDLFQIHSVNQRSHSPVMTPGSCFQSLLSDPLICVSWTASTALAEPSPRQSKQQRGIPNLSQLQHRTAGCCLPSKTGASFGMLSLILRKKAWLLSPRQWQQQSSSSSRKPRDICKERSSFNRKWNTHFFHDRTGHTRVF